MQEIESCDVCGHQQSVEKYADWKCEQCGSAYAYGDGFILQLTDEQKRLISKRGTCKECRHWDRNDGPPSDRHGCLKLTDYHEDDMAMPMCQGGDHLVFVTGPDFGCIHFEPINPPSAS